MTESHFEERTPAISDHHAVGDEADIFLYDGEEDVPQDAIHVRVDGSLRIIYAQAFFVHSNLRRVDLPEGLKIIRSRAFFMCEALSCVRFPSTLEEIETCSFVGCVALSQAILPKGLKVLGSAAFAKCESLTHFQVPPLIQVIDVSLFSNCKNLYSVELAPTGIRRIGSRAFQNCHQLRNIVLPESINTVEGFAFTGCTCLLEALSVPVDDEDRDLRVCEALKIRFTKYPLHKLCYYQGYYTESPLLTADVASNSGSNSIPSFMMEGVQELERLHHQQGGLSKLHQREEQSGMTPLHILALSSRPSLELTESLVKSWRTPLTNSEHQDSTSNQEEDETAHDDNIISPPAQSRDRWNRDPLMYASMNLTTEATAVTKFLLETLLSPLLTSLGLLQWRCEVTDEMDRLLYHSTTRSERVQHLEQVLIKLDRFLQMERLSLLELAIWKVSVRATVLNDGQPINDNGQGRIDNTENVIHSTMELTSSTGQQQDRAKRRTLCGAQLILSHVVLFLGDP